jgi:hypothetical protein
MGRVVFGIIGLVLGLVGGALFGGSIIGGTAAGMGVATGLSAGICSTMTAASEEGLLTDEQVDQILAHATTDPGGTVEDGQIVGTIADCEQVMQTLRDAVTN